MGSIPTHYKMGERDAAKKQETNGQSSGAAWQHYQNFHQGLGFAYKESFFEFTDEGL